VCVSEGATRSQRQAVHRGGTCVITLTPDAQPRPTRRPLLHALLVHGVAGGVGVELDAVKVAKAEAFCR
jgi:hypothetical protein